MMNIMRQRIALQTIIGRRSFDFRLKIPKRTREHSINSIIPQAMKDLKNCSQAIILWLRIIRKDVQPIVGVPDVVDGLEEPDYSKDDGHSPRFAVAPLHVKVCTELLKISSFFKTL